MQIQNFKVVQKKKKNKSVFLSFFFFCSEYNVCARQRERERASTAKMI